MPAYLLDTVFHYQCSNEQQTALLVFEYASSGLRNSIDAIELTLFA